MYRLLIADGDPETGDAVRLLLDWPAYGFTTVAEAGSYAEALNKAVDLRPHVALVRVEPERPMGFVLMEHLRGIGLRTVFCAVSGCDEGYLVRRAMRADARDYLLLPLEERELRRFVEKTVVNELHGCLPDAGVPRHGIDPVLGLAYAGCSKITNKILLAVKDGYNTPLSLKRIAEGFDMSSKYIGRVFLRDTGVKFTEYLMAYRMQEAKRLIVNTQEKVSVIATMVGYTQLNNFYIHFKTYFGVSPSALRAFDDFQGQGGVYEGPV